MGILSQICEQSVDFVIKLQIFLDPWIWLRANSLQQNILPTHQSSWDRDPKHSNNWLKLVLKTFKKQQNHSNIWCGIPFGAINSSTNGPAIQHPSQVKLFYASVSRNCVLQDHRGFPDGLHHIFNNNEILCGKNYLCIQHIQRTYLDFQWQQNSDGFPATWNVATTPDCEAQGTIFSEFYRGLCLSPVSGWVALVLI